MSAPFAEVVLELQRTVEMIDDGPLAAACDKDHLLDARSDHFFDAVLDGGFVDPRQHLFGLGFRDWQEAGPEAGRSNHRFAHGGHGHWPQSILWRPSMGFDLVSSAGCSASWRVIS